MRQTEKKSIVIWFLLAILIFIWFTLYTLIYLYPNILEIEEKKVVLAEKIWYHDTLVKKWFKYSEFKLLNTEYASDKDFEDLLNNWFYKKMYKDLDKNFYDNSIYDWDYKTFKETNNFWEYLSDRLDDLDNIIDWKELNDKILKISEVLPKYSTLISIDDEWGLTDLSFINYIEKILKQYNLKADNPIGIKEILAVENKIIDEDDNIYYIPLDLDVTWTKISILNFLKYTQNTGDIEFSDNDFVFSKKMWASSQLAEVENIEFKEYIDSSSDEREDFDNTLEWFLLKTKQSQDIITVKISLKFYISWLSSEKIRDKINSVIWTNTKKIIFDEEWDYKVNEETWEYEYELIHYNYTNLFNLVKNFSSNPTLNKNTYYKKRVDNIFSYLNNADLKKDFQEINKEVIKATNLDSLYTRVLKYKDIFLKLDEEVYEIAESLGLEEDKFNEEGKLIQKSIYPKDYYFLENK